MDVNLDGLLEVCYGPWDSRKETGNKKFDQGWSMGLVVYCDHYGHL